LMESELVRKEDGEYKITQEGKVEYSNMLRFYDLDRQSILKEETKRIEEITKKTIGFFEKFDIENDYIKFRFLNNVLKLDYTRVKDLLTKEEFDKILLYLSLNHPNQYPHSISFKEFSNEYNIKQSTLNFFVDKIVEEDFYPIKYFKLAEEPDKIYYFQANEKLEKVLRAITEDHITQFTYLNKLYNKLINGTPSIDMDSTVEAILIEICENIFNKGLKEALKNFLPDYINYLAYKVETERDLLDTFDKLEGVAWRYIPELIAYSSKDISFDPPDYKYHIDPNILKVLNLFSLPDIEKIYEGAKALMKNKKQENALEKINSNIERDPENLDFYFLKAIILSLLNRHQDAINLLKEEVKENIDDQDEHSFISYNFVLIFCYLTFGNFKKALKFSDRIRNGFPEHSASYITRALVFGYKVIYELDLEESKSDEVLVDIDKAIDSDPKKTNKAKYYQLKSLVLKQLKEFDEALEAINTAIDLDPKDIKLYFQKYKILHYSENIDEALEFIEIAIKNFPEYEIELLASKAFLYKNTKNFDEALKIIDDLREKYPDDLEILNKKIYFHLYKGDKEGAIEAGKLLTELDPNDGNYHDSYAEILTEFGEYELAIEEITKALELEPYGWFSYNTYLNLAKCYKALGKYDLAIESIEKGKVASHTCYCDIEMRKKIEKDAKKLYAEIKELKSK
ncbi:MAG: tetratricopeptide repeat protein, partial [Candidatus Hodarchaeota archaeon]